MEEHEYEEPLKDAAEANNDNGGQHADASAPPPPPLRNIRRSWEYNDDNDNDTNYFMSEPSLSEAESSEYIRPAHIPSLLAPRAESPSSASSKELLAGSPPPPPPSSSAFQGRQQQQQQTRGGGGVAAAAMAYPNSPGTSLSSWDSPHLFRKQVQLYFSPEKTTSTASFLDVPTMNHPATTTTANKRQRRTSHHSTSSSSTAKKKRSSDQFLHDLKYYSVGALKDARSDDFDSDHLSYINNNVGTADIQGVNAVIRNVHTTNNNSSAQHMSQAATAGGAAIIPHDDGDSTDQDQTLVMDLSTDDEEEDAEEAIRMTRTSTTGTTAAEPLDWEAKHSADDEKTAEQRPRRSRKSPGGGAAGGGNGHRRAKSGDAAAAASLGDHKATSKRASGGHRRTRSGDAAAASLMTGGQDWKGMQFDQLPIPAEHDDEDEHDQSHDSREVASASTDSLSKHRTGSTAAAEAVGGFAVGSAGKIGRTSKRPRRNQRVRRTMSREMNRRQETDPSMEEGRMSRDAFSRYALESPRIVPKYVGRASPTNESLSTIEHYTSERMESDSSGHGARAQRRRTASDVNFNMPDTRTHRTRYSASDIYRPTFDHRVSDITFDSRGHGSPFSYLSSKHEPGLSATSWDPRYVASQYQFAEMYQFTDAPELPNSGQRAYQFRDVDGRAPDDTSSTYSRSDGASADGGRRDIDADSNQLRYEPVGEEAELKPLVEEDDVSGKSHHLLRHRLSALKNLGKPPSSFGSRASYIPSSHSVGDYPTFVCPVCKTRQREFFTASSAPSQFQGPAGYLALYFAIYVIAALFIFGLEEGWPALDCVYFAVITLTTAGLGDFVPTSDGAKILCSIFIYFGVACIGLLLGSYLASMLDDKSYKQAQRNRVENCTNCARLKNLRTMQMRRLRQEKSNHSYQSSSIHTMRSVGFMSERNAHDLSHLGPHVLESDHKRTKGMPPAAEQTPSSTAPNPSAPPTIRNETKAASDEGALDDIAESNYHEVTVEDVSLSETEEEPETQSPVTEDEPKSQDAAKDDLDVIDSYQQPHSFLANPEFTPVTGNTSTSPGFPTMLGSPLTAQILGRQSHTRHMSFAGNNLHVTHGERRFAKPRGYSEDLSSRPQYGEAIPEDNPIDAQPQSQPRTSWPQQNREPFEAPMSEDDYYDDESESETSNESDDSLDEGQRRIKTAKYVFLTLKQALMNSILIIVIGSLGFFGIEGMNFVDSFYFTTCLLTTVGYGDIVPVTSAGKLFATIYVLVAGTILLHNMSIISFIPLELRKRRIEQAVLTQFGDQLDDATLRELATGPLVRNLQLSTHSMTGLEECTRETFALAMLVRLGKVSETDIKQTFKAFRRLDVDNEGVLTTKSIIAGMVHKHRSSRSQLEASQRSQQHVPPPPPPPPPPPFAGPSQSEEADSARYWYGIHGSLHVETEREIFPVAGAEGYIPGESERSNLMGNTSGYDSFGGQRAYAGGADVEQGYAQE